MPWKRFLFLFHRWVGIVLCVFFVLWFVSGIFMMYVEFPQLTRPERLVGNADIDFTSATFTPSQAVAQLARGDFTTHGTPSANEEAEVDNPKATLIPDGAIDVRLAMLNGRPAYVVKALGAQARAVYADDGSVLRSVDEKFALESASRFAKLSSIDGSARYDELLQTDQWTVSSALNDHRPLHRIAFDDDVGTELYVSSVTGEVVRDTHRRERVLNYFAAVTHWLYPTFIRKYPDAWEWFVDIASGVGSVFAISGLWIGMLRWRRKRAPGKPAVPYRGLMRWHYFTGVIFGVCLLTWVFSGLLSMNPRNLNPSRSPTTEQRELFTGNRVLALSSATVPSLPPHAVEAELIAYSNKPFYLVSDRDGVRHLVSSGEVAMPNEQELRVRAQALRPGEAAQFDLLTDYDDYYYTRHPERGEKQLPVLRVQYADADRTWFHIDPLTGQVLERSTKTNRLYRWLYNGLHSWDIRWLWERRPLWDIVVIAFMSGGIFLSVLGVVIGVRRLRY